MSGRKKSERRFDQLLLEVEAQEALDDHRVARIRDARKAVKLALKLGDKERLYHAMENLVRLFLR